MRAAIVRSFDTSPQYGVIAAPSPTAPDQVLVDVVAAGLHPRVRSQANGSHYTSTGELPLVPGVDGVGRLEDGSLVWFALADTTFGSMAEQTVIDTRRCLPLPTGAAPAVIAAAMNPGMSSWIALRQRVDFAPGQAVLVLGATGNAGTLAVQIARHLGAGLVIAAGRNEQRLTALGDADETVCLTGDLDECIARLGEVAADVDVVIDYLWGEPAERAIPALLTRRTDRSRRLSWVQIGAVAGPEIALPSVALRSANLQLLGSGQGSVGTDAMLAELPALVAAVSDGTLRIGVEAVPLADVEQTWATPSHPARRVVLIP